MTNLDVAFNYLLGDEGTKYTNNPDDSGGPTKFGITKRTYQAFFNRLVLDSEIEAMTPGIAKQIYEELYWTPLHCEDIEDVALVFALTIFDSGVLYGVGTIALITQRALSLCGAPLKLDGILGDKSIGFLNSMGGGSQITRSSLLHTFSGLLLEHIDAVILANPKDEAFRRGWTLRVDRFLKLLDDDFLNSFKTMEI